MSQTGIAAWQRSETSLDGAFLIDSGVFEDHRGFILESYRADFLGSLGVRESFVQENLSYSQQHVLRGLHFQIGRPQARLSRSIQGEVLSVAVDVRRGSPSFGQSLAVVLSPQNRRMLYLPAGFATGTLAFSESSCCLYHSSEYYRPELQRGIFWNDPALGIRWGIDHPVVSDKDARLPRLADLSPSDLPLYTP